MKPSTYLILGVLVAAGVYYYWTHRNTNGGTSSNNQAIAQDLAYYQAWNAAQDTAQPSGQNTNPQNAKNANVMMGASPVGFGPGNSQTPMASMVLPVNA